MGDMKMLVRVPLAATILSVTLAVSPSAGEASHVETQPRHVANSIEASLPVAPLNSSYESYRNLGDQQLDHDQIQEELENVYGAKDETINWFSAERNENLSGNYQLTNVTTHVINLDSNLEILVDHNLADDDIRTVYNRAVNGAEANSISSSFVTPKFYNATRNEFDFKNAFLYNFGLKSDSVEHNYAFRSPSGAFKITDPLPTSFNPLGWLASSQANDHLEFSFTAENGQIYDITITPRATKIDTLTFEITAREKSSLLTTTVVLTYSAM